MLLYYVAKDTNDYGTGKHKVINIFLPANSVSIELLSQQFNYVVVNDSLPANIAGYITQLTIDTTGNEPVVREKSEEEKDSDFYNDTLERVRSTRDKLIADTIWIFERHMTQPTGSKTLTDEEYNTWCTYWQSLRDITVNFDPNNIVWPTQPTVK